MLMSFLEPEAPSTSYSLIHFSRRAMATTFEVALPYGTLLASEIANDAFELIDAIEDQLSVYKPDSEVSLLNAHAGQDAVVVTDSLFALLEQCQSLWQQSEGYFDPATGALVKAWGFFQREGRVPSAVERNIAHEQSGFGHVLLNRQNKTVKFLRPHLELNLGSIGKGYALDVVADYLRTKCGIFSAFLQAGGSSMYGLGHPPGQPRGWAIAIKHPWQVEQNLGTIWLKNAGLGTSAATYQYFVHEGKKLGHVLDPKRGWPVDGTALTSALAPMAAVADARSTAVFVRGEPFGNAHSWPVLILKDATDAPVAYNLNEDVFDPVGPA